MKCCKTCNRDLPLDAFRTAIGMKDGYRSSCKECEREKARVSMKQWRDEHPELSRQRAKEYTARHPERVKSQRHSGYLRRRDRTLKKAAEYRNANRTKINSWQKTYRRENPEKRRQKDKESYSRHRDERLQKNRDYKDKHRFETRIRNRTRKLHIRQSNTGMFTVDWQRCLDYWGHKCCICGRPQGLWHIIAADHWMPLSRGGKTEPKNIVPLCHGVDGCNNSKHKKMPDDWLIEIFGPRLAKSKAAEVQAYFDSLDE